MEWKREVYRRYGTLFNNTDSAALYEKFVPYSAYIIRRCFPEDKESKILDLGCGIGGFISVCVAAGYQNVEGVDISEESVAMAHRHGFTKVRHGDLIDALRETSSLSTDVVLCLDVIEHFDRNAAVDILREIHRILKPDGNVIIHVPNGEAIFGSRVRYSDYTHEMAYTSRSIAQILRYTGFSSCQSFEDKPIVHGLVSAMRRILWEILTFQFRLLHVAETGVFQVLLSQNILTIGRK